MSVVFQLEYPWRLLGAFFIAIWVCQPIFPLSGKLFSQLRFDNFLKAGGVDRKVIAVRIHLDQLENLPVDAVIQKSHDNQLIN